MNRRQFLKTAVYGAASLALPRYASPQQQAQLEEILGGSAIQTIKDAGYKTTHVLRDKEDNLYVLVEALEPEKTISLGRGVTMDFVMIGKNKILIGKGNLRECYVRDFQRGSKELDNPRLSFEKESKPYRLAINPNRNPETSYIEPEQKPSEPANVPANKTTTTQRPQRTPLILIWAQKPRGLNITP